MISNRGYITLISVLVISAVAVSITVSVILLGLSSSRTSFSLEQAAQARTLAHACAEEGLQQIRSLTSFTGSSTILLGQGSCSYIVTSQGSENRTIDASGTVGAITKREQVIINDIDPLILVVSWQEVTSF